LKGDSDFFPEIRGLTFEDGVRHHPVFLILSGHFYVSFFELIRCLRIYGRKERRTPKAGK
jgi:hypothetical protein